MAEAVVEPEPEKIEAGPDKPKETLAERWDEAVIRQREAQGLDGRVVLSEVNAQRAAGNPRLALRTVERFLRHERKHYGALLAKAEVLVELGRFRDAVEVYETALGIRDDEAAGHFNYGVALTRLMLFGNAAVAYRRAIELDDGHVQAKYNLAVLYQREGSLTAAIGLWRAVNALSPKLASGWFHRGAGHLDLEQWEDAATCFEQVTKLEPEQADGWANLGVALTKQKRFDEAIEALRKTLALEPEQVLAMNALAEAYWERYRAGEGSTEDKSTAVDFARQSLALDEGQSGMRELLDAMFDEADGPGQLLTPTD